MYWVKWLTLRTSNKANPPLFTRTTHRPKQTPETIAETQTQTTIRQYLNLIKRSVQLDIVHERIENFSADVVRDHGGALPRVHFAVHSRRLLIISHARSFQSFTESSCPIERDLKRSARVWTRRAHERRKETGARKQSERFPFWQRAGRVAVAVPFSFRFAMWIAALLRWVLKSGFVCVCVVHCFDFPGETAARRLMRVGGVGVSYDRPCARTDTETHEGLRKATMALRIVTCGLFMFEWWFVWLYRSWIAIFRFGWVFLVKTYAK